MDMCLASVLAMCSPGEGASEKEVEVAGRLLARMGARGRERRPPYMESTAGRQDREPAAKGRPDGLGWGRAG